MDRGGDRNTQRSFLYLRHGHIRPMDGVCESTETSGNESENQGGLCSIRISTNMSLFPIYIRLGGTCTSIRYKQTIHHRLIDQQSYCLTCGSLNFNMKHTGNALCMQVNA